MALNSMSSHFYINKKTLARGSYVSLLFVFYILTSHLLSRGLLENRNDGFISQISSVDAGDELGVLGLMHSTRYLIIKPFLLLDNRDYEPLLFFCYFGFLFFANRKAQRRIATFCLLFSLFFSYRTVLVMLSIALLAENVSYFLQAKKERKEPDHNWKGVFLMLYALVFSLLSTGVFLSYGMIILTYRKLIIPKRWVKYFNTVLFFALFAALGGVIHKFLYFTNPEVYSSATSVSMEAFSSFESDALGALVSSLLERSFLIESTNDQSARVYIILLLSMMMVVLLILRHDRLSFLLMLSFVCGMFMEGLTFYSLLIAVLVLIGQELKFSLMADGRLIWKRSK